MKKLSLLLGVLLVSMASYSQNPIKLRLSAEVFEAAKDTVKYNTGGQLLHKGDYFDMYISANGNGNTTTRHLLFDFQYDNSALTLVSIGNTGTGGNGGILPQGSNAQESYYQYPGYTFLQNVNNTTSNGYTNYQYMQYGYTQGGPSTIVRYDLVWSGTQGMPYGNYWGFIKLRFQVKQDMVGYAMNPVQLNFVAGWNGSGGADVTTMDAPKKTIVYLNPNADSYINGKININANITAISPMKVLIQDTTTKIGHLYDITSDGTININQANLAANTVYKALAMINMDKLYNIYNAAVTVSDFTGPQNEFVKTNLDGTPANSSMTTGASYLSADMNNDKVFNGGDLPLLLAAAVAQDTLIRLPAGYQVGTNGYMSVWTFADTTFNNMTTTSWTTVQPGMGVIFKTGNIGDYKPLNLKYLLWGDVNRSHSSQVVGANGIIVTKALPSLVAGMTANSVEIKAFSTIQTQEIPTIDVSLNNTVVTSNNVTIPVNIDTKGLNVSALEFEFQYDPAKIKFDEIASGLPNTWYIFANSKSGKVKFGALDKGSNVTPITGTLTPFTLKFSTIGEGVDILTTVKVTRVMDASDTNGNQLGINLNTTQIKLTGYNNF